jgi:hypothetical protein
VQKFCCTGHRQQFWIAARRWTMKAIEAGLLSVECLKGSHTGSAAIGMPVRLDSTGGHGLASEMLDKASNGYGEALTQSSGTVP